MAQKEQKDKKRSYIAPRPKETPCETCMYFDYDEGAGEEVCGMDMDEDENVSLLTGKSSGCPYYRYYNEYKSVQKQN